MDDSNDHLRFLDKEEKRRQREEGTIMIKSFVKSKGILHLDYVCVCAFVCVHVCVCVCVCVCIGVTHLIP